MPLQYYSRQVFGVALVEMMRRNSDPGEEVPWVLKRFVGFLSKFGLEVGNSRPKTCHVPSQPPQTPKGAGLKTYV